MDFRRTLAAFSLLAAVGGCAHWPANRVTACVAPADQPRIRTSADGRVRSTELSVLIYNVEGLPWPARSGRARSLAAIGAQLAAMRAAGHAPDIVLLQEAFTPAAGRIGDIAGYANVVRGPARRNVERQTVATPGFIAAAKRDRGEGVGKLLNSGLYLLSDYPVSTVVRRGFSAAACAGFDCLAAKGMLLARIIVPGLPTPVDIMTAHFNANERAAKVPYERTAEAHGFQVAEAAHFIAEARDPADPLILGGDFNMKHAPAKFDRFTAEIPFAIVHRWCLDRPGACDVRARWDGTAPWLATEDLQAFDDGRSVRAEPVRVEALFDGGETGERLSDHAAMWVTYRLSWPTALQPTVRTETSGCTVA